jgi:hypothetical protein
MIEVNLFDREFIHTEQLLGYITCSDRLRPTKIKWLNGLTEYDGITIFTDNFIDSHLIDSVKSKIKIFWLLEPRAIRPYGYSKIIEIESKFDYILTYDSELLKRSEKYIKYVVGQSRVYEPKIYDKTKMVSMIASNKQITEGHRFRHEISNKLSKKYNIDMWGSGYKSFDSKLSPLSDYYFTVSVMNSKIDNFFTEVIVDNFMLGTVPIFWGCPNINEYFDERGIITFDTIDELDEILSKLTINDYLSRIEYIKNNFEIAKKYVSTDDIISDVLQKI